MGTRSNRRHASENGRFASSPRLVRVAFRVRPDYARFVVIRVLFVKKIASELTPIDMNIKQRVQIRRICLHCLQILYE